MLTTKKIAGVAVVTALAALGIALIPPGPLMRPTTWYVDSVTGRDSNSCLTSSRPCKTIQHACDLVPLDLCDDATTQVQPGYVGTGCRKEGVRRCCRPETDGGVKCGTWTITGPSTAYAPSDAGTGAGTIQAAVAGSSATCAFDTWALVGNPLLTDNEASNKWIAITSGTGSGTDHLWPISQHDAGTVTLRSNGRATAPVAGSGYQIYAAPNATINANLGQTLTNAGPEVIEQLAGAAAFIISSLPASVANGAANDPWIRIQRLTTTGGVNLVRHTGGPVAVREVMHQASGTLIRAPAGRTNPVAERNILTAGNLLIDRNASLGVDIGMAQIYDNLGTSGVGNGIFSSSAASIWSEGNYFPNAGIRVGQCNNCRADCDTWVAVRTSGENDPGASPVTSGGTLALDGTTLTGNGQAYTITIGGPGTVQIDGMGGPASTINAGSGNQHFAALSSGGRLNWQPTTNFVSSGGTDFVFTDTVTSWTLAQVRGLAAKGLCDIVGTCIVEGGASTSLYATLGSASLGLWNCALKTASANAFTLTYTTDLGQTCSAAPVGITCTPRDLAAATTCVVDDGTAPTSTAAVFKTSGATTKAYACVLCAR